MDEHGVVGIVVVVVVVAAAAKSIRDAVGLVGNALQIVD